MSAHTPAPWNLETVKTSSGFCHKIGPFPWKVGRDNHACIYVDYPNGAVGPVELELKANAQLMAAAPDLLEVMQDMFVTDGGVQVAFAGNPIACEALESKVLRAIAKATGASA